MNTCYNQVIGDESQVAFVVESQGSFLITVFWVILLIAISIHVTFSWTCRFFGNRSYCYDRMGQFEKALQDANVAITLAPDWPKGYFRRGRALAGIKVVTASYPIIPSHPSYCISSHPVPSYLSSSHPSYSIQAHSVLSYLIPSHPR